MEFTKIEVIRVSDNLHNFTEDELEIMEYIVENKNGVDLDIPVLLTEPDFATESAINRDEMEMAETDEETKEEAKRRLRIVESILSKVHSTPVLYDYVKKEVSDEK